MRQILVGISVGVLAVSALLVPAGPAGADIECDPSNNDTPCFPTEELAQFRDDINNDLYTSQVVRPALLSLASVIERVYPNDSLRPVDPYRAVVQATARTVIGFAQAGLVTDEGLSILLVHLDVLWPPVPI